MTAGKGRTPEKGVNWKKFYQNAQDIKKKDEKDSKLEKKILKNGKVQYVYKYK